MSKDFIPKQDAEFNNWYTQFFTNFSALASGLGFNPGEVAALTNARNQWMTAYDNHLAVQNSAKGARATKDNERAESENLIRAYVRRIQANPATTDQMRADLGITIASGKKTPSQVPSTAPGIELDWSERGQVTVHVGENPNNERINKMGPNAKSVLLQYRYPGGEWILAGVTTSSPFVHTINNTEAVVVEYRAQYLNPTGEPGPWSETDFAFVSPIQISVNVSEAA